MRQEEAIWELNTWCSGSDMRPQALQQAAERQEALRRELGSLNDVYNFARKDAAWAGRDAASVRSHRCGNMFAPEYVAALESQLLDARIERDRLGAEWAADLRAERRNRERAQALPVWVAA